MVSQRGIEANPNKIQAIFNMEQPKNVKEVQSLTGQVAELNRFVSRAIAKCLTFFKVLRKSFEWSKECQREFEERKVQRPVYYTNKAFKEQKDDIHQWRSWLSLW